MDPRQLQALLDYHYWARDRLLDAIQPLPPDLFTRDLGSSFTSIRDTLAHTYGAESIWCSRWQGRPPAVLPDSGVFPDAGAIGRAWRDLEVEVRSVFDRFAGEGIGTIVEYRDTKGTTWRQPFHEMLLHVVNHASYHRGQVTTMLRQVGAAPPASMDLVIFYRARNQGGVVT